MIVFLLDNGMPSYRMFSDKLTFYHSSNTLRETLYSVLREHPRIYLYTYLYTEGERERERRERVQTETFIYSGNKH